MTQPVRSDLPPVLSGSFPQPRYVAVAEVLQQEIAQGKYPVGSRLPPERELAKIFGLAGMTIRQAIGLLEKKGLLLRRHGLGTFVQAAADQPLIAVLFGVSLHHESADFYRAAAKAIEDELLRRGWQCRIYDPSGDLPPFRQLRIDLRQYPFTGVIRFATSPRLDAALADLPALPTVEFHSGETSDVTLDDYHFGQTVVEHLAREGRRRIAYFRPGFQPGVSVRGRDIAGVVETAQRLGLPEPMLGSILHQGTVAEGGSAIYEAARELIAQWGGRPPQALVIKDDVAMHAVAMALLQSGLRIPEDLMVACGGNDRAPQPYGMEMIRYLYPMGEVADALASVLEERILGRPSTPTPRVITGNLVPLPHRKANAAIPLCPSA